MASLTWAPKDKTNEQKQKQSHKWREWLVVAREGEK